MPEGGGPAAESQRNLTVVTPVFNEQEVIETFYQRTRKVLDSLGTRYRSRILFVVDRSTDGTLAILRGIAVKDPDAQILALSSRFGHQMSLLAGVDHATDADAIIMMDSDLQHPPELIPALLARFEEGGDIVYTIRIDTDEQPMLRRLAGRLFYGILGYLSATPMHGNAADFRLISARVADTLRMQIRERGTFLRGILSWVGFEQVPVEYRAGRRLVGQSKYSPSRMIALGTAGILSFSTKPLRLGVAVGIGFAFLGFLYGIVTVFGYFVDSDFPAGYATIVTLLLVFSGVQLVFMGIIGIYIGGIYEEVKGRPHYIVQEAINVATGVNARTRKPHGKP